MPPHPLQGALIQMIVTGALPVSGQFAAFFTTRAGLTAQRNDPSKTRGIGPQLANSSNGGLAHAVQDANPGPVPLRNIHLPKAHVSCVEHSVDVYR